MALLTKLSTNSAVHPGHAEVMPGDSLLCLSLWNFFRYSGTLLCLAPMNKANEKIALC